MANLAGVVKSPQTLGKYLKSFKEDTPSISFLKAGGKSYLALDVDTPSGSFLVLSVSDTSGQCRISLMKLKTPEIVAKYKTPKKLVSVLPTDGWKPSTKEENSYFQTDQALRDMVFFTYMKNKPSPAQEEKASPQVLNSPILKGTLEDAIKKAIQSKNLKGLTLWPTQNKGWQGNAQNKLGGWSVQFNSDPVKALLMALVGVVGD